MPGRSAVHETARTRPTTPHGPPVRGREPRVYRLVVHLGWPRRRSATVWVADLFGRQIGASVVGLPLLPTTVVITGGAARKLNARELASVVGHELMHRRHLDLTRYAVVAAAATATAVAAAQLLWCRVSSPALVAWGVVLAWVPLQLLCVRWCERLADLGAVLASGDAETFALTLSRVAAVNHTRWAGGHLFHDSYARRATAAREATRARYYRLHAAVGVLTALALAVGTLSALNVYRPGMVVSSRCLTARATAGALVPQP